MFLRYPHESLSTVIASSHLCFCKTPENGQKYLFNKSDIKIYTPPTAKCNVASKNFEKNYKSFTILTKRYENKINIQLRDGVYFLIRYLDYICQHK